MQKQVLVTGATSGVGKAAALALAQQGQSVGIIGRNPDKGAAAIAEIKAAVPRANVTFHRADLADLDQVRALGGALVHELPAIHALINNAGVINLKRKVTRQGFEETFAVNHLAHFLLTALLLPSLRAASDARIINVSSDAHIPARLDFGNLQLEGNYFVWRAYSRSKLANLYFTFELARRLAGTGITVNALHPGAVGSNFAKNNGFIANLAMGLLKPFFLSEAKGADTAVYLASSPEVAGRTGGYYEKRKLIKPSKAAQDPEAARQLWDASEALTRNPFRAGLTQTA